MWGEKCGGAWEGGLKGRKSVVKGRQQEDKLRRHEEMSIIT